MLMSRRRIVALLAVPLWVGALAPSPSRAAPPPTNGAVRVGEPAPEFALPGFDGRWIRLADRLGTKPVLIVFWSYFCFPCQRELPQIEALYRELGGDQVDVIGISLDGPEYDARVRPFVEEHGITFPNAYDRETEEFFETAEHYGVVGTPTSFLLDPGGRVRFIHLGRLDPEVIRALVHAAREQSYCPEITKPAPGAGSR